MLSERRLVPAALALAAALLTLASCRGIYLPEPEPEPESGQGSYSLVVDVTPPEGPDLDDLRVSHDNSPWVGFDDSLRRREEQSLLDARRLVFEGLLAGPTLVEYFWRGESGDTHRGTWGVVQIPGPPLEMDFSRPNVTLRSRWTVDGEVLQHTRLNLEFERRLSTIGVRDLSYTSADSLNLNLISGSWRLSARWDFPLESRLASANAELADSLVVPGSWDLGPEFSRVWIEPLLGGEPLRNAEFRATLWVPAGGLFRDLYLSYRDQTPDEGLLAVAHAGPVFQLQLYPGSAALRFPWRRWWLEAAAGDTLQIELAKNRVRLRLREGARPASFLAVVFDSQRLDTGAVTIATDEQGEAILWLPDGLYRLGLGSIPLALVGSDLVEVVSDTLLTLEVQAP